MRRATIEVRSARSSSGAAAARAAGSCALNTRTWVLGLPRAPGTDTDTSASNRPGRQRTGEADRRRREPPCALPRRRGPLAAGFDDLIGERQSLQHRVVEVKGVQKKTLNWRSHFIQFVIFAASSIGRASKAARLAAGPWGLRCCPKMACGVTLFASSCVQAVLIRPHPPPERPQSRSSKVA